MKPSIYNFVWPGTEAGKAILFNSLSTALAQIGSENLYLLEQERLNLSALSVKEAQFISDLLPGGFVVPAECDEQEILKYAYNRGKYSIRQMALTIAPTLRCNFRCTYCYEQAGDVQTGSLNGSSFMTPETQAALVQFVQRQSKPLEGLHVTWYGGEPLLAPEIITRLSDEFLRLSEAYGFQYHSEMITNGYLLTCHAPLLAEWQRCRIRSFQITLDGPPDVHNPRRMLANRDVPTFDTILAGIRLLSENGFLVKLRINIDRNNAHSALSLLDILNDLGLSNLQIYLGRVNAQTAGCKSFESACASVGEYSALNRLLSQKLGGKNLCTGIRPPYPAPARPCGANRCSAFTVDPAGNLYKCWAEIGDPTKSIGHINEKQTREQRLREIKWLNWEPFAYPDCAACQLLPVCMGGCGYQALYTGRLPECGEWKYNLRHFVAARYAAELSNR